MNRRRFLEAAGALSALPLSPFVARASTREHSLVAQAGRVAIVGDPHPATDVWCFNGRVPGPEIRVRQGDRLRVAVTNRLAESTTVHWHGVRVPNAMDGVPELTQAPIAADGGTFTYEFEARDAGTYWYHPHSRSFEQIERGLHGVLVVEERKPPEVDRDVTWVLDDWRLRRDASIADDFVSFFDVSHAGRIGNTVTVNGAIAERFEVRSGERVRLRLVNVANARSFGLQFAGHRPRIIAFDGQPVEPHEPEDATVVVGSSQRVDLVIDAAGEPGSRHVVRDVFYPRQAFRLLDLVYRDEAPLRATRSAPKLEPNDIPEPDLARAQSHEIVLTGGMMGGRLPEDPLPERAARRLRQALGAREADPVWAINGVAMTGDHSHKPLLAFKRGASVVLDLRNDTAWPHPMHLHGHVFRVLSRNGRPTRFREWRDTVLLAARESTSVAFVADNPGDWMLHCHILEHQAGGMMATFRVG